MQSTIGKHKEKLFADFSLKPTLQPFIGLDIITIDYAKCKGQIELCAHLHSMYMNVICTLYILPSYLKTKRKNIPR